MNWVAPGERHARSQSGGVHIVGADGKSEVLAVASLDGLLPVAVSAPGPAMRGRLGVLLECAIEDALERHGSAAPGVDASTDLNTSLSDQLYRARRLGASGLALWLPPLAGIANLAGTLDAEDSAILRWWMFAAAERPIRVLIDERNRRIGVYGVPSELQQLVDGDGAQSTTRTARAVGTPDQPPMAAQQVAASCGAASASPPGASRLDGSNPSHTAPSAARETGVGSSGDGATETDRLRMLQLDLDLAQSAAADDEADLEAARSRQAAASAGARRPETTTAPGPRDGPTAPAIAQVDEPGSTSCAAVRGSTTADPSSRLDTPPPTEGPGTTVLADEQTAGSQPQTAGVRPPAPLHATAHKEWRNWMRDLDRARGPRPLAAVERLFVTRYVPLSDALHCGIADCRAEQALRCWSDSFARSYLEAFDALRLRDNRPTMVLDVPDLALRIARLHGARSIQLLMVDGMRFDVGLRVHEYVRSLLGQSAALTEKLLLWAALPSTTSVQLELLRRGPRGLQQFVANDVAELPIARGRNATTLRRLKSGHRELLKLDVVEARMTEPGGPLAARLDAVSLEAAEAIATHFLNLPQRTLVVLFGDHGFRIKTHADGSWTALQGGASPEEVLVPAFAWLVGSVH
jgi:hypothetical protein